MKDLDLSAFDEDVEETELDLSAFDEEPEVEELPKGDNIPGYFGVEAAKDLAKKSASGAAKGTRGLVRETIGKVPFGNLDADDVSQLFNKRKRYKELKNKPEQVADAFADFAKTVENTGYTATKNVGDVLESKGKSMKTDDLISELETRASDISYEPDAARLKEAEDAAKGLKDAEKKVEKAKRYYDKIENNINDEIEELNDRIEEYQQKGTSRRELNEMRNAEKQSLNEMLDDLKSQKRQKELEILEYKKAGGSKYAVLEIQEEIKKLDIETDKINVQKRKLDENLANKTTDLAKEIEKDQDILKTLKQRKKELTRELKKDVIPNKKAELSRLEGLRKGAEKTAKEKAIQRKALTEEAEKYLDRLKKQLSNKKVLTGDDLAKEMKRLNKQFGKPGADEIRNAFREMLQSMDTYVGESGKKAAQAITDYKNVLELTPLKTIETITDAGKGTDVIHSGAEKFNKVLAGIMSQTGSADEKGKLIELLKRQGASGLLEDAELNRILELTKSGKATLIDIANTIGTGGKAAASTGRTLDTLATKAQELATLGAGKVADTAEYLGKTKVGKALGATGKVLGKVAGPLGAGYGAYSGFKEAEEYGIEEPWKKAIYSGIEGLSPVPMSTMEMAKSVKEFEEDSPMNKLMVESIGSQFPSVKSGYDAMKALIQRKEGSNLADDTKIELENYVKGLDTKMPKDVNTYVKDINNSEELSNQLRSVNEEYANRIDSIRDTSENKDEYERKISMLNSEPAFRELVRRQVRRMKDEQGNRE